MRTDDQTLSGIRQALESSEFLRAVASVRRDGGHSLALGGEPLRRLSLAEVRTLERLGNTAEDWGRVRVAEGFAPQRVRNCHFEGDVALGRCTGRARLAEGLELPAGLSKATVVGCVIGHEAVVHEVRLLAHYVVGAGAVLLDCGRVTAEGETAFGNGAALRVALEAGGREVAAYAEIDVATAAAVATSRGRARLLSDYAAAVADYRARASSRLGLIEAGARVQGAARVVNTYVGPHARIEGATLLADSTLLSNAEEPAEVGDGACVRGALLQWGSRVSTQAVVERSVLTEHSHAERHAKVTDSILGPNTAVGGGEVTSCLLGPFVGCHHQSLLISTFWPSGRGNIGYGANVGSNHTSRAPDQEFWAGEGLFLGLGVNVKFPSDFSRAPYSVVACGTNLLPQKVTFPFSLIMPAAVHHPDVPPAYNEIIPAWMLGENFYALRRNEAKYQARNQARRSRFDFAVLRPDTVDLMLDACLRLAQVPELADVYTERDIEGLGKNFLSEAQRQEALSTYRFYIRYYALGGLKDRVGALLRAGRGHAVGRLLSTTDGDSRWEHQRRLLWDTLHVRDVASGLAELPDVLDHVARGVEAAKAKDDRRGARIIEDYAEAHAPADRDECVRDAWEKARSGRAEVERLLSWVRSLGVHPPEGARGPHGAHRQGALGGAAAVEPGSLGMAC
jgi:hypothetical protein